MALIWRGSNLFLPSSRAKLNALSIVSCDKSLVFIRAFKSCAALAEVSMPLDFPFSLIFVIVTILKTLFFAHNIIQL